MISAYFIFLLITLIVLGFVTEWRVPFIVTGVTLAALIILFLLFMLCKYLNLP